MGIFKKSTPTSEMDVPDAFVGRTISESAPQRDDANVARGSTRRAMSTREGSKSAKGAGSTSTKRSADENGDENADGEGEYTTESDYGDDEDWWGSTLDYFEDWAGSTNEMRQLRKKWILPVTVITALDVSCAMVMILCYSMVGYGANVYRGLSEDDQNYKWSWIAAGSSAFILLVLYLLDGHQALLASGKVSAFGKSLALALSALALGGFVVAGLLSVEEFSTLPLVLYILAKCGTVRFLKQKVFKRMHIGLFLRNAAIASYFTTVAAATAWAVWVGAYDKKWKTDVFLSYQKQLGCNVTESGGSNSVDYFSLVNGNDGPGSCANVAYIMYAVPLAIAVLNLLFGLSCHQLAKRGGALQLILILVGIAAAGTWSSISLASVQMGVADDIIQLLVLLCALFAFGCFLAIGPERIYKQVLRLDITKKVIGYSHSDLAKALLFCITMTFIPFGLALSAFSSAARKLGISWHVPSDDPEAPKDGILTAETSTFMAWWFSNPQKVFKYASYISIGYFCFTIGVGKAAVLFLAWLIGVMKSQHVAVVIFVFIAIGVFMFLLPPIPGPPVYITGGLLIVGAMEKDIGFWSAAVVAIFVNEFTKLFSSALQQKLIGERLSGNVSIRYQVGINSLQMRAIRYCLEQKGLTLAKVAILCGGPDWPTSVLCGILRLPLFQCAIGAAPIIFLYLGWCTLAGALLLKVGSCGDSTAAATGDADQGFWGALNSIALALTFITMMFTASSALFFMEHTVATKREILDAMPIDEEVLELEKNKKARDEVYESVTRWSNLTKRMRSLITLAAVTGVLSVQLGVVLAQRSFKSFSVSCPIPVKEVILPTGWVSVGLICASIVFLNRFLAVADRRVTNRVNEIKAAYNGVLPSERERKMMIKETEESGAEEPLDEDFELY